jgi:hypothetical protein
LGRTLLLMDVEPVTATTTTTAVWRVIEKVTAKRFPKLSAFLKGESVRRAVSYCVYDRIPTILKDVVCVFATVC